MDRPWTVHGIEKYKQYKLWTNCVRLKLIPIQDKIDLANAREKKDNIGDDSEETAVKMEEENGTEDNTEEISSEVKLEESEDNPVMVQLAPEDRQENLKMEEIDEIKIEESSPIGIGVISSNNNHIWYY